MDFGCAIKPALVEAGVCALKEELPPKDYSLLS